MTFPSFYAECAFNDGFRDATEGHCNSASCFVKWGEIEPIGMGWYNKGREAAAKKAN